MKRSSLKTLFSVALFKTVFFNLHFLGLRGLHLPVLLSRKVSLKSVGGGITVESYRFGNVKIGFDNIGIGDGRYQRVTLQILGHVFLGEGVNISAGVKICCGKNGRLVLNKRTTININSQIVCMDYVELGENVMVSWDDLIIDSDFHQIIKNDVQQAITAPILIGRDVWIGCRSVVLKGCVIPNGCIIGANCTVSDCFKKENSIIAGNRIISEEVSWKR